MSRRVSKRLTSLQGVSKTKRHVTDDELHIDQAPKKRRHENGAATSSSNRTQLDRPATTTGESLCNPEFDSDLAKAIKLSLTSAEESCETTKLEAATTLNQHYGPQHKQCPLCDVHLKVSETAFELHVNQCLDQSSKSLSIPTATTSATVQQKISSWDHMFQSIPNALQNSWIGKMVSTEDKHSTVVSSTSASTSTTVTEAATTIATTSTISTISLPPPSHGMNSKNNGYLGGSKPLPMYKWMKDTRFIVDAFNYGKIPGCDGYFLTHFHSDHYGGLNRAWYAGPIYCSQITANLVLKELEVDQKYIRVLPMNEPTFVTPHIKVTLIDANHCPGSALFIFDIQRVPEGDSKATWVRHLHTGDFRANPRMCLHPMLRQPDNPTIDNLYLDTTYLNAKYGFPAQEECIQAACSVIKAYMGLKDENRPKTMLEKWMGKGTATTITAKNNTPPSAFDTMMSNAKIQKKTQGLLVVVGTYLIGKEKVFCAIAKLLKSKIYTTERKRFIYRCQENPELENMLTNNPLKAQVHILPLNDIKTENMLAYLKSLSPRFTNVIAFRPTGWTYRPSKAQETDMSIGSLSQVTMAPTDRTVHIKPSHSSQSLKIYGLPYSEHSSFRELASFIASLEINHVVPTVYYESEKGRQKMLSYLEKWQQDKQGKPVEVVPYPAESHW